jgi:tetratricopeptide (TPR) repeat protein
MTSWTGWPTLPIALLAVVVGVAACTPASGAPTLSRAPTPAVGSAGPAASPAAAAPASSDPASSTAPGPLPLPTTSATQQQVDFLLARVAADPGDGAAQRDLGLALLQRIRETSDPSGYPPAEAALQAARRLLPGDPLVLVGLGGLRLGRHAFAEALKVGREAVRLTPAIPSARAVVVDALIELGRYREAFKEANGLAAASPDLSTLARLSYARELQGDLRGALTAMRQAAASPGLAPENTAYVTALVGHLQRLTGDPSGARRSYEQALALVPGHAPSMSGLGHLALGDGDLAAAERAFREASAVVPLPEYVIALGETLEIAGDAEGARRQYELARAEIALFKANGVVVDLELALFEADHGDASRALELARAAYAETPTVRAADALGWALHRLGRDQEASRMAAEALRLGSRDPLLRFHAGAIEATIGKTTAARADLRMALSIDPGFSATGVAEARRILGRLPG